MATLKELRLEHGVTQQKLADLLGVTRQAVQSWETGRTAISQTHRAELLIFFGEAPEQAPELGKTHTTCLQRLRCERTTHTVKDIAQLLGVQVAKVHAWESGHREPRPSQLMMLAPLLGMNHNTLCTLYLQDIASGAVKALDKVVKQPAKSEPVLPQQAQERIERETEFGLSRPDWSLLDVIS